MALRNFVAAMSKAAPSIVGTVGDLINIQLHKHADNGIVVYRFCQLICCEYLLLRASASTEVVVEKANARRCCLQSSCHVHAQTLGGRVLPIRAGRLSEPWVELQVV